MNRTIKALATTTLLTATGKPARNDYSRRLTLTLVAERITGHIEPAWVNDDMIRGQLDEPIARDLYSSHFELAEEIGFLVRDDWGWSLGFSPDGVVGEHGLIEVKSRRQKKHLQTILDDAVPSENFAQLQAGLLVSGREWIDYISFCGGMPLFVKRVYADAKWQEAIVDAVSAFEQVAEEMALKYDVATRGMPATERRLDLEVVI